MSNMTEMEPVFLRLPAVLSFTGHGRTTAYRKIADGTLPPPVRLGPNSAGWPKHEISAVNRQVLAGDTPEQIRALVKRLVAERKGAA